MMLDCQPPTYTRTDWPDLDDWNTAMAWFNYMRDALDEARKIGNELTERSWLKYEFCLDEARHTHQRAKWYMRLHVETSSKK